MNNSNNKSIISWIKIASVFTFAFIWIRIFYKSIRGFSFFKYLFGNNLYVDSFSFIQIFFDFLVSLMLTIYPIFLLMAIIFSIGDTSFAKEIISWRSIRAGIFIPFSALILLTVGILLGFFSKVFMILFIISTPVYFIAKNLKSLFTKVHLKKKKEVSN